MTADRLLGSTLGRLSIKPPPVICAHALILFRLFSCKIDFTYIFVGVNRYSPIFLGVKFNILS